MKRADELPGVLARIAEVLGEELALRVVDVFGGRRMFVCENPPENGELTRAVGLDAAQRIAAEIGAGHVEIPLCKSWKLRRLVMELIPTEMSAAKIAKTVGCHERTVWRYRREYSRQLANRRQSDSPR